MDDADVRAIPPDDEEGRTAEALRWTCRMAVLCDAMRECAESLLGPSALGNPVGEAIDAVVAGDADPDCLIRPTLRATALCFVAETGTEAEESRLVVDASLTADALRDVASIALRRGAAVPCHPNILDDLGRSVAEESIRDARRSMAARTLTARRAVTTSEAARVLGVTPSMVRRLILSGHLSGCTEPGVRGWLVDPTSLWGEWSRRVRHGERVGERGGDALRTFAGTMSTAVDW